jgi:hypothetical protein
MNTLSTALQRLLDSETPLTASAFSAKQRAELERFSRDTRLIEISKQRNGTVYCLADRERAADYVRSLQPLDDSQMEEHIPARSRNIGKERNSKKGRTSHARFYLLMKAWDTGSTWHNGSSAMQVAELTGRFGAAALQIASGDDWQTDKPLLLVENQALFDRCDWLPDDFGGCIAYYAGQLPEILLQWLAERRRADEVVLFPDYDGVGLSNYVRLAGCLHRDSVLRFYWLPDWENKLVRFGNPDLWKKTRLQFENAINRLKGMHALTEEFSTLARLAQCHGKALEQEAIWL